jgi:8-oxo-dGTP pyrophosphatase MutT (NUDIX family)
MRDNWDLHPDDGRNRHDHGLALEETGFWGRQAAGCLFLAKNTGRILIAHRSWAVLEPGTWGGFGGAIDEGEDPAEAARREALEETGYDGPGAMVPLLVFRSQSFRYYNFLFVVEREFDPELNWEAQDSAWCRWGDWPEPLHFGLEHLFADAASVSAIEGVLAGLREPAAGHDPDDGGVPDPPSPF